MDGSNAQGSSPHDPSVRRGQGSDAQAMSTDEFMAQYEVDDTNVYMQSNAGGSIEDQESLSAGERGPTLLEDFIFREKIMHFGMFPSRRIISRVLILLKTMKEYQNALFTREVLVLTVFSLLMLIGQTLPERLS